MLRLTVTLGFVLVYATQGSALILRNIVPPVTRIVSDRTRVKTGSEINLICEVDANTVPDVYWTKNGVTIDSILANDRIFLTGERLKIEHANKNDSGLYGCHTSIEHKTYHSTVRINVQDPKIPPTCTDNPYFANCNLIVKSKVCGHKYYSRFCCKACVEAGELIPNDLDTLNYATAY